MASKKYLPGDTVTYKSEFTLGESKTGVVVECPNNLKYLDHDTLVWSHWDRIHEPEDRATYAQEDNIVSVVYGPAHNVITNAQQAQDDGWRTVTRKEAKHLVSLFNGSVEIRTQVRIKSETE